MRLFTIKRTSDGKFFVSINGHYAIKSGKEQHYFADSPVQFLKTADGVAGNLRKLCSEPYWDTIAPKGLCPRVAEGWKQLSWRNFDREKLTLYEVVILDVDILSMTATPASDFAQIEAIENVPLSRRERQAEGNS